MTRSPRELLVDYLYSTLSPATKGKYSPSEASDILSDLENYPNHPVPKTDPNLLATCTSMADRILNPKR